MASERIILNLTTTEAAMAWNLVDAQLDAGACKGGNTPLELEMLRALASKLLKHHSKFSHHQDALAEGYHGGE